MKEYFSIRRLEIEDAPALASLLQSQRIEYARFFTPFDFGQESIARILARCKSDVFMGICWQDELAGFFMLRGWDDGYAVPAYGVFIDEKYSGYGLTILSLRAAKTIAKLCRASQMMLKVHPANVRAKRIFERGGFVFTKRDDESDNLIYHFTL